MSWVEIGSKLYKTDTITKVVQYDRKGTHYIDMWTTHPKYTIKTGILLDSRIFEKVRHKAYTFSFTNSQTRDRYYKKLETLALQNVIHLAKDTDDMVKLED